MTTFTKSTSFLKALKLDWILDIVTFLMFLNILYPPLSSNRTGCLQINHNLTYYTSRSLATRILQYLSTGPKPLTICVCHFDPNIPVIVSLSSEWAFCVPFHFYFRNEFFRITWTFPEADRYLSGECVTHKNTM